MPRRRRKSVMCSNCQYRFDGIDNYCPNCGQENHSHHVPIKHLVLELIEGLTHFDTKFFNTTKALFTKPGQLTADYIVDRRARYVPPIRLYIFASFIFFISLPLFSEHDPTPRASVGPTIPSTPNRSALKVQVFNETLIRDTFAHDLAGRTDLTDAVVDSLVEAKAPHRSWIIRQGLKQTLRQELGLTTKADLEHAFIKNSGIALFVLMPIFALILKLFYLKRKRLYIEHLIFSLHFHGFAFVLLTLISLLYKVFPAEDWLILILLASPIVYGMLALHRVYGGKPLHTVIKSIFIFPLYAVCLLGGFLLTLVASFITL